MGSKGKVTLNSRFPCIKKIDVEGLKGFISLMASEEKDLFNKAYGNLLKLLQLDIQESAIIALSRFYDPDLRCFLFKDFQLSPTIEEYDQILGFSRSGLPPYQYQKHRYTDQRLSLLLQVSVKELELHKEKKNRITGFPLSYFEGFLKSYAQAGKWGPFKQLLALAIFGIVLFPQVERFIDENAIGVFLGFIDKGNPINPVYAVLADTYYSFTHHRVLGKKKIACSLHVLYAWLLNHIITRKEKVASLIDYALSCEVDVKDVQGWSRAFGDLNALQVNWFTHSCWEDRPLVLFQCGSFQNVPLMGTQGCINYNPSLTIRQLGYPMKNAPTEDMLACIFFDKEDPKNQALFQRISKAWGNLVYKGRDEIAKKTSEVTFYQWLHKRIQDTRLPPQNALLAAQENPEPCLPTHERIIELESTLAKAEEEKKMLQDELERITREKEKLEKENAAKMIAMEESDERFKQEEERRSEAQKHLKVAREELQKNKQKMRRALEEAEKWKSIATKPKKESRLISELRDQLKSLEQEKNALDEVLKDYQRALGYEREISGELKRDLWHLEDAYRQMRAESQHWHERFMALIGKIEEQGIVRELREDIQLWRSKFARLSELANQAIVGIPRDLRTAETKMNFFNTPPEVYQFVESCRALITELRKQTQDASANKKRKRDEDFKALCI